MGHAKIEYPIYTMMELGNTVGEDALTLYKVWRRLVLYSMYMINIYVIAEQKIGHITKKKQKKDI